MWGRPKTFPLASMLTTSNRASIAMAQIASVYTQKRTKTLAWQSSKTSLITIILRVTIDLSLNLGQKEKIMGTKKVDFNQKGIAQLPNNKPVLYRIETDGGKPNYVGIAQRGEVQDRVSDHLGEIPGAKVQVEQFSSIQDARKKEANVIKQVQPKYNKQGK
jgi:hypothetical protein